MWLSGRLLKERAVRGLPLAGLVTVAGATLVEVCTFLKMIEKFATYSDAHPIQIMLGAYYTFGNMSPYLVSYLRNSTGENYTYRYAYCSLVLKCAVLNLHAFSVNSTR